MARRRKRRKEGRREERGKESLLSCRIKSFCLRVTSATTNKNSRKKWKIKVLCGGTPIS